MCDSLVLARLVLVLEEFFPKDARKTHAVKNWEIPKSTKYVISVPSCALQDAWELQDFEDREKTLDTLIVNSNILLVTQEEATWQSKWTWSIRVSEFQTYCKDCHEIMHITRDTKTITASRQKVQWELTWDAVPFRSFELYLFGCERCLILTMPEYDILGHLPNELRRLIVEFIKI